ncbi:DUF7344 domain-containing protein [Haloarcula nitratireducens]|uniref:DUF7344 domain-containing protein n=1 Tax=Haloarcula nitratireducens TaxID=2487749 RepID=A0AAW4PCS3_9EURY|nr:hypothetical protein [Halomicroarcula nitratireducens]MBX0295680.1 hypothetical protein [Halomicroarcula nitratireducens]
MERQSTEPSLTEVYGALADDRRRAMLSILTDRTTAVDVATLARTVAARETGTPVDDVDEETVIPVRTSIYHVHLPKLANAGIIRYNEEQQTVELAHDGIQQLPLTDQQRSSSLTDGATLQTAAEEQLQSALNANSPEQTMVHVRQALQLLRLG